MSAPKEKVPNFPAWRRETLDSYAEDAFLHIVDLREANAQLRSDLRDAMEIIRSAPWQPPSQK
jgi:hypothetical protein